MRINYDSVNAMFSQWCSFCVVTVVLLSLLLMPKHSEGQFVLPVVMRPNEYDQVLDAGTTLNLTCIIPPKFSGTFYRDKNFNISWRLPDHLAFKNEAPAYGRRNVAHINSRLRLSFGENETHLWSTMTLTNTEGIDTGYYTCETFSDVIKFYKKWTQKKYVYFFDGKQNVVKSQEYVYGKHEVLTGDPITIPCLATHSEVTISLTLKGNEDESTKTTMLNETDLLSGNNSRWSYDRGNGLILNKSTLDDSGEYTCIGTMNGTSNRQTFFFGVYGVELNKLGDSLERSNVTLICRRAVYGLSLLAYGPLRTYPPLGPLLTWSIKRIGDEKLVPLNATDLPEGMNINSKRANYWEKSELNIFEVPLNVSGTEFECSTAGHEFHQTIYLRVKEINSDPVTVQLNQGRPTNLTCNRPSTKYNIQWLRNGNPYSGDINLNTNNSSVLQLQGSANEAGKYTCHWNNSIGEARYKHFTVIFVDRIESPETITIAIPVSVTLAILLLIAVIVGVQIYLKRKRPTRRAEELLKGNHINPNLSIEEPSEQIPYDTRWEFPRHRLKLGAQLGAGCFGVVVKAEAIGLKGSNELSKTVAVKMVRSKINVAALEDLVRELKVLIYLGSHLNVLNLLGACTTNLHKGDLLIIVEYCQFGNLQSHLVRNRNNFISQLDEYGNMLTSIKTEDQTDDGPAGPASIQHVRESAVSGEQDPDGYLVPSSMEQLNPSELKNENDECQTISTKDLVSWSFQIALGMGYLASKKVLHGDLAARNVLLAENGVVKVSDFGMARKMYYEENYKKDGQSLMPIKWMAPESLTDRIFSTESDVWSYGILLWELFSLGKVPYPDIDSKQLMKELENGYRMEKPNYAPNFIEYVMNNCWENEPKNRPSFSQIEQLIAANLETSVSSYYSNLNAPYEKFNYEKTVAPKNERFGLAKLLNEKNRLTQSVSQPVGHVVRYSRPPERFFS